MKALLTTTFLAFCFLGVFAQSPGDTIVVQSLHYGSQTRDTMVAFPDLPGVTFEKILMRYNMRCKNGLISPPIQGQTNVGCGEWDYSCNTSIIDSSRIDSTLSRTDSYLISGFSGTTYNYSTSPTYTFYQFLLQTASQTVATETAYQFGTGGLSLTNVIPTDAQSSKSQYLYTAAELGGAGVIAGDLHSLELNILGAGDASFLRIKIRHTSESTVDVDSAGVTGWTEVYFNAAALTPGLQRLDFYQAFTWDGVSNIIVEFSNTNTVPGAGAMIEGTDVALDYGMYSADNAFLMANNGQGFDIPTAALSTISNEITVSFWTYGDETVLPANTSAFEGWDAAGNRQVNMHLPWSNSRVYFDCGNIGSGYDRIDQLATVGQFAGQWNHWAFTKNAATGSMKAYVNGALFVSGTGKTNTIDIQTLTLLNYYYGKMDEVRIWDAELTQTDIQDWMYKSIDATHPAYVNLVAYYPLDEATGTTAQDASVNAATATGTGAVVWGTERGADLDKFFTITTERPNIAFYQGNVTITTADVAVLDSVQNTPNFVTERQIVPMYGTLQADSIAEIAYYTYWEAVDQIIYDENGVQIGTVAVATDGTINVTDLLYYARYPMKFEITSFVTPYGINLDLGMEGVTYTMDLTDFSPILKGNKQLLMDRGGQWQEEMNISFWFIVGTPPRDVIDINQIWRVDSRSYSNIIADDSFEPRDVALDASASGFKVRTTISGHGQEGEFIPREHYVDVDGGTDEFVWQVWKSECPDNPVFPQGGTWIYERAGWCPGMETNIVHNEITSLVTPGTTANIDYGMYTASGSSNYIVNNQLVQYGAPNHALDANIVDVVSPNNKVEHGRLNSICDNPTIVIQNTGSSELTTLTIKYWVNDDANPDVFTWTGSLAFLETEVVELPVTWNFWHATNAADNMFYATVEAPNGGTDEYAHNDTYTTKFAVPDVFPNHIWLWTRTNSAAFETSIEVIDPQGNVMFSRSGMSNNTEYKDTLQLQSGCYQLIVHDSDDDGMDFFANNDGNGWMRIREVGGGTVANLRADHGSGVIWHFTVDAPLNYDDLYSSQSVEVYPNPFSDQVQVEIDGYDNNVSLKVYNMTGALVIDDQLSGDNNMLLKHTLDMSNMKSGVYTLVVDDGEHTQTKRLIKQ